MKIMIIADYYGSDEILPTLEEVFEEYEVDIIVFVGNVVKAEVRKEEWEKSIKLKTKPDESVLSGDEAIEDELLYRSFFFNLASFNVPVLVIPGDLDAPIERFNKATQEFENVINLHRKHVLVKGIDFYGFGGNIGKINEDKFMLISKGNEVLKAFSALEVKESSIILTHIPPIGSLDVDKGKHIGSKVVDDIIRLYSPEFLFCGHAYHSVGESVVNKTLVVNPGALMNGRYAIVDLATKKVKFPTPLK